MKTKINKAVPPPQKYTDKDNDTGNRLNTLRRILPRLAAVFLIVVFLASECADLLPVN